MKRQPIQILFFCKILILVFLFSCKGPQQVKKRECPLDTKNQHKKQVKKEVQIPEYMKGPKGTERFSSQDFFFAGKYLWLPLEGRGYPYLIVGAGNYRKTIKLEELKKFECDVLPLIDTPLGEMFDDFSSCYTSTYWPSHDHRFRHIRGLSFIKGKVLLSSSKGLFTFNADGTFLHFKEKEENVWDSILEDPRHQFRWRGDKNGLYFKKKRFQANEIAVSGKWLAVLDKKKKSITIYERASGKETAHYKIHTNDGRLFYTLRENQKGFFISYNNRPYRWFGEKIIDLQDDTQLCYILEGKKKCTPDYNTYKWIEENDHFRIYKKSVYFFVEYKN